MDDYDEEDLERIVSIVPGAAKLTAFLLGLIALFVVLIGWYVVPLELMTRRQFGERYLGLSRLLMALLVFGGYLALVWRHTGDLPRYMFAIPLVCAIAAILHLGAIRTRNRLRIPWHSRSLGISRLTDLLRALRRDPIDDWTICRAIEPGLFLALGACLAFLAGALGFYLATAAVAMAIRAQLIYATYRNQYLDRVDDLIEEAFWTGHASELGPEANAGFWPVRASTDLKAIIAASQAEVRRLRSGSRPQTEEGRAPARVPADRFIAVETAVRANVVDAPV